MGIDDILADKVYVLDADLDRLFKAAGCNPGCHACKTKISIGDEFELLSYKGTDEMVCAQCGRPELEDRDRRKIETSARRDREAAQHRREKIAAGHSGYSRPTTEAPARG